MVVTVFSKVNQNWVIVFFRLFLSIYFNFLKFFWVPSSGGAPNYYPNSFTGPADEHVLKESRMSVSGDVQRFSSANEDNVSQV